MRTSTLVEPVECWTDRLELQNLLSTGLACKRCGAGPTRLKKRDIVNTVDTRDKNRRRGGYNTALYPEKQIAAGDRGYELYGIASRTVTLFR